MSYRSRSTIQVNKWIPFLFGSLLFNKIQCFSINLAFTSHSIYRCSRLYSASEFHTNYEYVARQKGNIVSECITWIDPSENIVSTKTNPRKIGIQVDDDDNYDKQIGSFPNENDLRLPIYPVSAVHLPSSATHTLHNTQLKNVKMSRDLRAGKWDIGFDNLLQIKNNTTSEQKKQCFVLTLFAQDTYRLASVGTLVEVLSMEDTYAYDNKTLLRVVVKCRSLGLVEIHGFQEETINKIDDYLIGKVRLIQTGFDHPPMTKEMEDISDCYILDQLIQDYETVRNMYTNKNSVASSELPPYARDAVKTNMPSFLKKDFLSHIDFWDIAECYQMLCNTIRDARRSELQAEINEIMIEAASKKKGPLTLPVKRESLPDDVQSKIRKMEQDESEDFLSSGLDPALDFQVLLGIGKGRDVDENSNSFTFLDQDLGRKIHLERINYLANMIKKEKDRLEVKESLKNMFKQQTCEESKDSSMGQYNKKQKGGNDSSSSNHFE